MRGWRKVQHVLGLVDEMVEDEQLDLPSVLQHPRRLQHAPNQRSVGEQLQSAEKLHRHRVNFQSLFRQSGGADQRQAHRRARLRRRRKLSFQTRVPELLRPRKRQGRLQHR